MTWNDLHSFLKPSISLSSVLTLYNPLRCKLFQNLDLKGGVFFSLFYTGMFFVASRKSSCDQTGSTNIGTASDLEEVLTNIVDESDDKGTRFSLTYPTTKLVRALC